MKKDEICKVCKIYLKDQLWEWKTTDEACQEDWSRTILLMTEACQNIEACTKDSQRYENSEWTFKELQNLHACTKNKNTESWNYEVCQ